MFNKSGSTIVLAMLILATILATAGTFAIISISDFRQVRSIDQAIVSYYLAEVGIERGAFYFRKLNVDPVSCGLANCTLEVEAEDKGNIGILAQDTSTQIDIYDPSNLLLVPDIKYLYLTWYNCTPACSPAPRLEVSWAGWSGGSFGSPTKKVLFNPTSSQVNLHEAGIHSYYRVRFKALFNNIESLQVIARNNSGDQKNIPGLFEVKAIGTYGKSQQASAINAGHLPPLSGLYDYALFSEEPLHKAFCGDGIVEGSEQCDDGRQCSAGGVDCTAAGSDICYFEDPLNPGTFITIGDGRCLPRDGDGCSAGCEVE